MPLYHTHAENYQKTSNPCPPFPPVPLCPLPSLSSHSLQSSFSCAFLPKKVSAIKNIIMKGRPNNLTKTLLRSRSPPVSSRADPNPNKNPERNLPPSQPELTRFSSSDSKPKLTLPLRNDRKPDPQPQPLPKMRVKAEEDDNTTQQSSEQHISYVAGEYQLEGYDLFKRKNVQFQEKPAEILQGGRQSAGKGSSRNSSILKNGPRVLDRSGLSSDKSLSLQNSFTAKNKCKLTLPSPDAPNLQARRKYEGILEQLRSRREGEKYIDDLFPPVEASLFATSVHKKVNLSRSKEEIVWLRLSEIFPGKKLRVFARGRRSQGLVVSGGLSAPYLADCFNAIGKSPELLATIFQSEEVSPYGVYLVKIYQEHSWRYVIVDDLVPCVKKKGRIKREEKYSPAFLNINPIQGEPVYLWPFLLEKAYANYYNCYENLNYGNIRDFLSELTGTPYSELPLTQRKNKPQPSHSLTVIAKHATDGSIMLGYSESRDAYLPLFLVKDSYTADSLFGYHDPTNNNEVTTVELAQLPALFSSVFLYTLNEFSSVVTCPVYPPKAIKPRPKEKAKSKYLQLPPNDTTSMRTFTIFKKTRVRIDIRQKENRFYYQTGITEYLWVRCLFLQREYDGGFRWIAGKYASQKHMVFQEMLEAGEYMLVVMVEWRERHNKEITVVLHSDCDFLKFQRRNFIREERVVELACMDLAQRFGKLSQINKSICAYTHLCQDTALIIENIVNERTKGDVTIMRSISGLRSKVEILPLNPEFQVEAPEEYATLEKGERRRVIDQSVEIDIKKGESYTVVLRMRGGIDRKFFKVFNFG